MYNLFGCIILICLVLNLGFVSCFVSGQKKIKHARRNAKSAIIKIDRGDLEIVPTVDEGISTKTVEAASDFLKKSLFEFFNGVVQTGIKHNSLPTLPNRTVKLRHLRKDGFRRHKPKAGKRRQKILKIRNDTDVTGRHRERKCKFPFIYDGKTIYSCLKVRKDKEKVIKKRWCSTTSNYDRDMLWDYCGDDGTPVKRSRHTPYTIQLTLEQSEDAIANMAEKKTLGDLADIPEDDGKGNKKKEQSIIDELCDTCDNLPKNNTESAVNGMQEEIDDVDKNDERIHSLVSKEVDNFIGSVLAKHGVPDTEQKELLALNAKLSTELAQEVSCKMNIDQKIGTTRYDCKQWNLTDVSNSSTTQQEQKSNVTSLPANHNTTNDEILKNEVDNFISTILSQHGVPSIKQKEIVKFIRKASTDIADQISYVVAYAKAGGIIKNDSETAKKHFHNGTTSNSNVTNTTRSSNNSIHTAVDSFLGLVLEKNGVPDDQQKDILAWNAQLSTDISDQVNNIVEDAKKIHEHTKGNRKVQNSHTNAVTDNNDMELISQLKPNISMNAEVKEDTTSNLLEPHWEDDVSKEVSHLQESLKPVFKPIFHSSTDKIDNTASNSAHTDKDPLLQSLYNKAHGKEEPKDSGVMQLYDDTDKKAHGKEDPNDDYKSYDDVSTENDIEIGLDDMNVNGNGDKTDTDVDNKGIAPDVVDAIPNKDKQGGDNEIENATTQHQREPQFHPKNVAKQQHKMLTGDDDWDKYLMDNMWDSKSGNEDDKPTSENLAHAQNPKDDQESINAEREQLDEDEKNMINYVSDSIIQSVKNVGAPKDDTVNKDNSKDISFKKLDSGKKPFSIFRVKPGGKGETNSNESGMDSIDIKTQKIIPGARNINIIIINNQNSSSLDLNEIENTIARSGEISLDRQNETNIQHVSSLLNIGKNIGNNSTASNKSSENKNLFLLLNTTATKQQLGAANISSNDTKVNFTDIKKLNNGTIQITVNRTHTNKTSTNTSALIAVNSTSGFNNSKSGFNNSKNVIQTSSNFNFSRLLGEYDKNLEASSMHSLRKSGLINMNYAPEEIFIRTYGGNANGAKCKFPFIFDGDTYFNCINTYREKPWCSATANYDKLPIWGYCNGQLPSDQPKVQSASGNTQASAVSEKKQEELADIVHNEGEEVISKHSGMKTYGGNANGARCVIPFVYDGQTHMRCIPRTDGTAWCAASHSYDIHPVWGNCCDNNVYMC